MPWASTWWTGPNKPWFILFSYPVFMTVIFSVMLFIIRRIHQLIPQVGILVIALVVGPTLLYLYNFAVDGASVNSGVWNYVDVIGPSVVTRSGGLEPLLWPAVPFAIYGGLMLCSLLKLDATGQPWLLGHAHAERLLPGLKREVGRALAAVVYWNFMYWFFMTLPVNLGRELFGGPSKLVP
jgi:hypothetical protein